MIGALPLLLLILLLSVAGIDPALAQEGSSANLVLLPSQQRIPQADKQTVLPPELFIPPIDPPVTAPPVAAPPQPTAPPVVENFSPFRAPLISNLERGKWYVQIGAYTRADHVEDAISRVGTTSPVVIHNIGTDTKPLFRVLLGPFSRNESKAVLQRYKKNGYDAFERIRNEE